MPEVRHARRPQEPSLVTRFTGGTSWGCALSLVACSCGSVAQALKVWPWEEGVVQVSEAILLLLGALLAVCCTALALERRHSWRASQALKLAREEAQSSGLAREEAQGAVDLVLSNPNLVELILAHLPRPTLCLCKSKAGKAGPGDRWAAAQVNKLFREVALRLPWKVEWGRQIGRAGSADLDILHTPRSLQSVSILGLGQSTLEQCAILLGYARRLDTLHVACDRESTLLHWLQHPLLLPSWDLGVVLDGLSTVTALSLDMTERPLNSVSWLTALQQLHQLELKGYGGLPLAGFPHLRKLSVMYDKAQGVEIVALQQWASPDLTDLLVSGCALLIDFPAGSAPQQGLGAIDDGSSTPLSALQCLRITRCLVSVHSTGLQELIPALTRLVLDTLLGEVGSFEAVLAKGLPLSLRELSVTCWRTGCLPLLWPAIFSLSNLERLFVYSSETLPTVGESGFIVEGLTGLPKLEVAGLYLPALGKRQLKRQFGGMGTLLRDRGSSLAMRLDFASMLILCKPLKRDDVSWARDWIMVQVDLWQSGRA